MEDLHASRALVRSHEQELEVLLRQGLFKPIFLYHVVLFQCLPLIGLMIRRRALRCMLFAVCLGFAFDVFKNRRALMGGNGYMLGLITAWWLVWNATLLIHTDVERDFQRIERSVSADVKPAKGETALSSLTKTMDQEFDMTQVDGQPNSDVDGITIHHATKSLSNGQHKPGLTEATNACAAEIFYWQPYPEKFSHRLNWCAGLLYNLRGPEWNWRAPHMGPIPRSVQTQLHPGTALENFPVVNDASIVHARNRLRGAFLSFIISYLILDALKFLMMHEPYFLGTAGPDSLPPFPISYLASSHLLLRFYHCLISCVAVYVALIFVTALNPIIFLGLSLAFPRASRKLAAAPLDASWLYSDTFGPFIEPILDNGLAGCWGRWWHQLFRYGFVATARWILSFLPARLAQDSRVKPVVYVLVAFSISGFVHASGSYTQFRRTHPLSGPFLFFFMQGLAIIAENIFKTTILPKLPFRNTPRGLRRTANAVLVFCWLLYSGPFIANDFARGGLWVMEPLPFSPIRALGLAQNEGAWCWRESWFQYWNDGTYWGSGIRII
ncbi:hypothetical protein N7492_000355 [Penicillium capsulatum]|uniref:Wax synthase domain-containing protein n=1 Tax=Penicillium capsulatum TaxID=69766 RepID=A0A9W9LZB4_9EURO|nr:hypothetical protein N7492_000355 [Penicillium capsulatum]KAJ6130581.1 hypothetical protein N7512_003361 [Penicillium capsulatum]